MYAWLVVVNLVAPSFPDIEPHIIGGSDSPGLCYAIAAAENIIARENGSRLTVACVPLSAMLELYKDRTGVLGDAKKGS